MRCVRARSKRRNGGDCELEHVASENIESSDKAVIEAVNEAKGGNRKGKAKATGRVCSCTRPRAALARRRGCVARSVPGGDFRGRTRGL